MGPTPCFSLSQVVFACQHFRPVASYFVLSKISFLAFFFNLERGMAI